MFDLRPFDFVHYALAVIASVGHVQRFWRALVDDLALALAGRVAPHPGLLAVEQVWQAR